MTDISRPDAGALRLVSPFILAAACDRVGEALGALDAARAPLADALATLDRSRDRLADALASLSRAVGAGDAVDGPALLSGDTLAALEASRAILDASRAAVPSMRPTHGAPDAVGDATAAFWQAWTAGRLRPALGACASSQLFRLFRTWCARHAPGAVIPQPAFTGALLRCSGGMLRLRIVKLPTGESRRLLYVSEPAAGVTLGQWAADAIARFEEGLRAAGVPALAELAEGDE